jgi:plastocyanin
MFRPRLLAAPLLAALVLAAALALPGQAASIKTVKIHDASFKPHTLTIGKGTKVRWKWTGSLPHNVTVVKGPQRFHSRTLSGSGHTFTHRFTKRGRYVLECTIHLFRITVRVR